jgi:hypothetical protein
MNFNNKIYGYAFDGYALCVGCVTERDIDVNTEQGFGRATALFEDNDDGEGLSCDGCHEYIFEPQVDEENDLDRWANIIHEHADEVRLEVFAEFIDTLDFSGFGGEA